MQDFDPSDYRRRILAPVCDGTPLPDYFERYLLDTEDSDENAIRERLREVKAFWDRERDRNPKYRDVIERLSKEHKTASLTVGDPAARADAARQARAQRLEEERARQGRLAEFEARVTDVLKRAGGLSPRDRRILQEVARGLGLDESSVTARLDRCPVLADAATAAPLPDNLRRQIRDALRHYAEHLGRPREGASLYHFLGVDGPEAGTERLRARWEERSKASRQLPPTYVKELTDRLLSYAKTYVIDGDMAVYLATLRADVSDDLRPLVAGAAVDDGAIDPAEAEQLVNAAQERGLRAAEARELVVSLASELDIHVVLGGVAEYVSCLKCNHPHVKDGAPERCRKCGEPLFANCPECKTKNPASAATCSKCGSDLAAYAAAVRSLDEARAQLERGRPLEAMRSTDATRRVLAGDPRFKELLAAVERSLTEARSQWNTIEASLGARRLYGAAAGLRQLARTAADVPGPSNELPDERLAGVTTRIAEVEKLIARARSLGRSDRESALVHALDLAADAVDAERELAAIKPAPPGAVSTSVSEDGMTIQWSESSSPGTIAYRVLRGIGVSGTTSSAIDVGTVQGTALSDPSAPHGAVVRYAVLCERAGVTSDASWSAPSVFTPEVQGLAVLDGDGAVELRWNSVSVVGHVEVLRSEIDGGAEVALSPGAAGVVDRDVVNGKRYRYRVRVSYAGVDGEPIATQGRVVYGAPAARPMPVEDLVVEDDGDGVAIRYGQPATGTVQIIRCRDEPRLTMGEDIHGDSLPALGEAVAPTAGGARDAHPVPLAWYVPVTIAGGYAVAGQPVRHARLSAIENVRVADYRSTVRVTWSWPDDVRSAVVVWRRDRQPTGVRDDKAARVETTRAQYTEQGGVELPANGSDPVFVAVFPSARVDGEHVTGATAGRGARAAVARETKIDVRYCVRRLGRRGKRVHVSIVEPANQPLPEFQIVARQGDMLPRAPEDGRVVAQLGGTSGGTEHQIDLGQLGRPVALRLFAAVPSVAATHRVHDPDSRDLIIR